jgi:hypothetical protein
MLKKKPLWVIVGSKQMINRFMQIVRQEETSRNTNAIKELVQTTQQELLYRTQSMRCNMASPFRSYKHSLSMRNFKIKNLVRTRQSMEAITNRVHSANLHCWSALLEVDNRSIGSAPGARSNQLLLRLRGNSLQTCNESNQTMPAVTHNHSIHDHRPSYPSTAVHILHGRLAALVCLAILTKHGLWKDRFLPAGVDVHEVMTETCSQFMFLTVHPRNLTILSNSY